MITQNIYQITILARKFKLLKEVVLNSICLVYQKLRHKLVHSAFVFLTTALEYAKRLKKTATLSNAVKTLVVYKCNQFLQR